MSGMFDECMDCCGTKMGCITISRIIWGFEEYVISHDATNPITYFTGKKYRTATYNFSYTDSSSGVCGDVYLPCDATDGGPCGNYSFSEAQTYTASTNVPVTSGSGTGPATPWGAFFAPYGGALNSISGGYGLSAWQLDGFYTFRVGPVSPYADPLTSSVLLGLLAGEAFYATSNSSSPFNAVTGGYGGLNNLNQYDWSSTDCCTTDPSSLTQPYCGVGAIGAYNNTSCQDIGAGGGVLSCETDPTNSRAFAGTWTLTDGGITSNSYSASLSLSASGTSCAEAAYSAEDSQPCLDFYWGVTIAYAESCSVALTNEVDYSAIISSVNSVLSSAQSTAEGLPSWGTDAYGTMFSFADFPVTDSVSSWPSEPGTYDGHLCYYGDGSGYGTSFVPTSGCIGNPAPGNEAAVLSYFTGTGCTGGLPTAVYNLAMAGTVWAIGASWFGITASGIGGGTGDEVDTDSATPVLCTFNIESDQLDLTSPYCIATYAIFNDGSVEYESCVNGVSFGDGWTVPPDVTTFPGGYFTGSTGSLKGPIGRVSFYLLGQTTLTWGGP